MATASGFIARLTEVLESVGRERARRELLNLNDRYLADLGFSRELLEEGVQAWPWRISVEQEHYVQPATAAEPTFRDNPTLAKVA